MADLKGYFGKIFSPNGPGPSIPIEETYKDLGDGTYAQQVQIGGSVSLSGDLNISDGDDVTQGAINDDIVPAGAVGTISAKLRRATQGLEDLKTSIVLAAGSAILGKVGIDQTTPGTTNGVQVNAALPAGTNSIGQVTANAGTNLNTSALARETGGNLATLAGAIVSGILKVFTQDLTASGNITAAQPVIGTPVSNATITLPLGSGQGTWAGQVLGTGFSATSTLSTEYSKDGGTTWQAATVRTSVGVVSSFVGGATVQFRGSCAGYTQVRVRCTPYQAGDTIAVVLTASVGADVQTNAAQDGTDPVGTNAGTQAGSTTAGVGLRGWLSTLVGLFQNGSAKLQGNVAAAATDSGNPVKVGGIYNATLPTLTDGQRGDAQLGANGLLFVRQGYPAAAYNAVYNAASSTGAQTVKAATPAKSIYITDVVISTDTQQTVKLQDNTGTPIVAIPALYLPGSGTWSKTFQTPIQVASGNLLAVVCGGNIGNVSVQVTGWVQ